MSKIKQYYKYLLALLGASALAVGSISYNDNNLGAIAPELQLKTTSENILYYEVIEDGEALLGAATGTSIVMYKYKSDLVENEDELDDGYEEDISKRQINAKFYKKDNTSYKARIYPSPTFYNDGTDWHIIDTATTTLNAWNEQYSMGPVKSILVFLGIKPVHAIDFSIYSGSGDGRTLRAGDGSWATAHDGTTGTGANPTNTTVEVYVREASWVCARGYLVFDTRALPDTAVISSATIKLTQNGASDRVADYGIVQSYQAATSTLVTADYEDCGSDNGNPARAKFQPVEGATRVSSSAVADSKITWTLNATGRGWIEVDDYTQLGFRQDLDMDDTAPSGGTYRTAWRMSEYTGTSSDPILELSYTLPSPAAAATPASIIMFE